MGVQHKLQPTGVDNSGLINFFPKMTNTFSTYAGLGLRVQNFYIDPFIGIPLIDTQTNISMQPQIGFKITKEFRR